MVNMKSLYKKVYRFSAEKKAAFYSSMFAIILSLLSLGYSIYQGDIDIGHERYEFWKQINGSLNAQEKTDLKIYPMLFNIEVNSKIVISGIHGDTLECSHIHSSRHDGFNIRLMERHIAKDEEMIRLENEEQYGLENVILENGDLADNLSVRGWSRFLKEDNDSNKWWSSLSWATMQLGFFPSQWAWRCSDFQKRKKVSTITITSDSIERYNKDLQTVILDNTYIENRLTPNVVSLKNLETENMPHPYNEYGELSSIYGPLNKHSEQDDSPLKVLTYATSMLNNIVAGALAKKSEERDTHN